MKNSAIVFVNLEKAYDRVPKEARIARSFEEKEDSDSVCSIRSTKRDRMQKVCVEDVTKLKVKAKVSGRDIETAFVFVGLRMSLQNGVQNIAFCYNMHIMMFIGR